MSGGSVLVVSCWRRHSSISGYLFGAAQQQDGAVSSCQSRAASSVEVLGSLLQDEAMVGSAPTPLSRAFLHVANAIDDSLRVRVWTLGDFLKEKENGIFSRAIERINSHRYSRAEERARAKEEQGD
jgi:hypothetical protein